MASTVAPPPIIPLGNDNEPDVEIADPDKPVVQPSLWAIIKLRLEQFKHWLLGTKLVEAVTYPASYHDYNDRELCKALNLHKQGADSGRKNLPARSSSRESCAAEQQIDSCIEDILSKERERATSLILAYDKAIRNISFTELGNKVTGVEKGIRSDFGKLHADYADELHIASDKRKSRLQELEAFKAEHERRHMARYPQSQVLGISIILILLLVETIMNAVFFAEGSDLGLVGGAFQAFVLSVINISFAGLTAHFALRGLKHRAGYIRLASLIGFSVYLVAASGFLLFIAKYRQAFIDNPESAYSLALSAIQSGNYFPESAGSLMFFLLSLLFALVALIDIYLMDDPYPGYGRIQRLSERARDDEIELHTEVAEKLTWLHDLAFEEQQRMQRNLDSRMRWLESNTASCEKSITGWQPFVERIRQLRKSLLATFREENKKARNSPAPAWFESDTPLADIKYRPPERAIPDCTEVRAQIQQLKARTDEVETLLKSEYARARSLLSTVDNPEEAIQ